MRWDLLWGRLRYGKQPRIDRKKRRMGCLGDSITFGAGVVDTREADAWPFLLQKSLGEDWQVFDYGVSGATLQKEGHFPYVKYGFLPHFRRCRPGLVTLMLGTNDTKPFNWNRERFAREYDEAVEKLLALPWHPQVVIMTPPRPFPDSATGVIGFDVVEDSIVNGVRPTVLQVGEKYGVPVIDLYAFTENHPEYFIDGVHPNREGNRAIADYLLKTLPLAR